MVSILSFVLYIILPPTFLWFSSIFNSHLPLFFPFLSCLYSFPLLFLPLFPITSLFPCLRLPPTDSCDGEFELSMVRHQPEGLDQLQAQTQFTRKELQSLYRGFKNVWKQSVHFHPNDRVKDNFLPQLINPTHTVWCVWVCVSVLRRHRLTAEKRGYL